MSTTPPATSLDEQRASSGQAAARAHGRGRLAVALVWSYVHNTGGYTISGLLTFVLMAMLDPRSFGVMMLAQVWIVFVQMLLHHGPTLAVIQQDGISEEHYDAALWANLLGAGVISVVFAALAPLWAALNGLPELTAVCLALTPIILLHAAVVVPDAVLRRRLQLRGIALRGLVAAVLGGAAGVAGALAGWGVWALVAQQLTNATVYAALLWLVVPWRPRLRRIGPALRDMRGAAVQSIIGFLANFVSLRVDTLLLGPVLGPVAVGLYRSAARLAEMVVDVSARGLQQISLPELARMHSEPVRFASRLGQLLRMGATLAFPALAVLATLGEPLLAVIGDQWAGAAAPLAVLCGVSALGIVTMLLGSALQAAQRTGVHAAFNWLSAACLATAIPGGVALGRVVGTTGRLLPVALTILVTQTGLTVVMAYVTLRRVLRVPAWPVLAALGPALLSSASAATGALAVRAATDLGPLATVLLAGGLGLATGGAVLLTCDAEVRSRAARLIRRLVAQPADAA